ncbi:hypothetical protein BHE74_00024257 [Ensete ventricosum]|nr:hypothetical protein GW17_00014981 [Ensete ventricosum]RWW68232.1 hypothetical protein BHE74_00024257 [Ensete ventricosum]
MSEEGLRVNLDLLKEQRAEALQTLAYKKAIAKLYNRKGKLALNWEGPYRVTSIIRDKTYQLATQEGNTCCSLILRKEFINEKRTMSCGWLGLHNVENKARPTIKEENRNYISRCSNFWRGETVAERDFFVHGDIIILGKLMKGFSLISRYG